MGEPQAEDPNDPPANGSEALVREHRNIPNWPVGSWFAVRVKSVLLAETAPVSSSRPGALVEFWTLGEQ